VRGRSSLFQQLAVDQQIATIDCTDGTRRPVYEDGHGRQYVLADDGERG
jgi:hypothetical protein